MIDGQRATRVISRATGGMPSDAKMQGIAISACLSFQYTFLYCLLCCRSPPTALARALSLRPSLLITCTCSAITDTEIKYIIYKLDDPKKPTKITVGKASESQSYDDFLEEFTDSECAYAVYDFEYDLGEGKRNKICFFIW